MERVSQKSKYFWRLGFGGLEVVVEGGVGELGLGLLLEELLEGLFIWGLDLCLEAGFGGIAKF